MANITDAERRKRLLSALPKDGSAVGNRYLAKEFGWSLDSYFKLRDELVAEKRIEVGRGRGGSVRLASSEGIKEPSGPPEVGPKKERALYPGFLDSLKTWALEQSWTDHVIQQTSDQGARRTGGRFTRPDFVVIGTRKYEYTPGVVRDIETFEVKPLGAPIDAVFEAASHSRSATKSYLALEVSENDPTEDELGRIESECQRFGLGLITFKDAKDFEKWQYRADPIRKEPDPELVEQFIRDQISVKNQEHIRKWMR